MREELKSKEVLAVYDVRGIQSYIYRTNKIKEIVGASVIVENIITDGLNNIIDHRGLDKKHYIVDWENEENMAYLDDPKVMMQVMFIGGGNAYVLYRNGEICSEFNRALAMYILNQTYSLNPAVAVVQKTAHYEKDYKALNLELQRIKMTMPETKPVGALPIVMTNPQTGYAITNYDYASKKPLDKESYLKRQAFPNGVSEKLLDNMVSEKGDSSILAIVHIDGNSMGSRIKGLIEGVDDYKEAVKTMRRISKNIKTSFNKVYDDMCKVIDAYEPSKTLHRKIIVAGDDITFIVQAEIALSAAEYFLKQIVKYNLYNNENLSKEENCQKYGFSACAGIAYMNSHFPFSDGYEVAEACVSSAKARAKESGCRDGERADGNIGNFMDYQICKNINARHLKEYRTKNYETFDGKSLIQRPYYVAVDEFDQITNLNELNEKYSFSKVKTQLAALNEKENGENKIPRSIAKKLRNIYTLGEDSVENYITFLKSRDVDFIEYGFDEDGRATWYEALELMDLGGQIHEDNH